MLPSPIFMWISPFSIVLVLRLSVPFAASNNSSMLRLPLSMFIATLPLYEDTEPFMFMSPSPAVNLMSSSANNCASPKMSMPPLSELIVMLSPAVICQSAFRFTFLSAFKISLPSSEVKFTIRIPPLREVMLMSLFARIILPVMKPKSVSNVTLPLTVNVPNKAFSLTLLKLTIPFDLRVKLPLLMSLSIRVEKV